MKLLNPHRLLLAAIVFATSALPLAAREFTDLQGRKLEAELMSVAGGQATLKRVADNRMFTLPVASFSEADQKVMHQFAAANVKYSFDVAYAKKKVDSVKQQIGPEVFTLENWAYQVELRNKQPVELKNLRVDYWLFRKDNEGKGAGAARVAAAGSHKAETVLGSTLYQFETVPVALEKRKLEGNYRYIDGSRPRSADVMGGLVMRIYTADGREVFKFATDDNLYPAAVGRPSGNATTSGAAAAAAK